MEVDNKQMNEVNYNEINQIYNSDQRTAQLGNPRTNVSLTQPRQERNGFFEKGNYDQLAGHSEPDLCHSNMAQSRQTQNHFFLESRQITYPS